MHRACADGQDIDCASLLRCTPSQHLTSSTDPWRETWTDQTPTALGHWHLLPEWEQRDRHHRSNAVIEDPALHKAPVSMRDMRLPWDAVLVQRTVSTIKVWIPFYAIVLSLFFPSFSATFPADTSLQSKVPV